jgi:hypothetical protein
MPAVADGIDCMNVRSVSWLNGDWFKLGGSAMEKAELALGEG